MKTNRKINRSAFMALSLVFVLTATVLAQAILPSRAGAAQIVVRKLDLRTSDNGLVGGSTPGGAVNHEFTFTVPTAASIGSIQFEYCTTPADVGSAQCVAPTGLDVSAATFASSSGITGLTMVHDSTRGTHVYHLTRSPGATVDPGAGAIINALIKNAVNPTTKNQTFFVRIKTFSSLDATTGEVDAGSVAASTADPILLSGVMPESLVFCTGATVGLDVATSTVPDCSTSTPGTIQFDQLFSSTDTAMAMSQMAASTNAGFGYAISVNGPTLTSGNNTITPIASPAAGVRGTSQFGLNVALNTSATAPGFGIAPYSTITNVINPVTNGSNFKGQATADYLTPNTFKFVNGDVVANSHNGYTQGVNTAATDAQIFTISYIANVPGSQAAGTYATTLTYVCTPTY